MERAWHRKQSGWTSDAVDSDANCLINILGMYEPNSPGDLGFSCARHDDVDFSEHA